MLGLYTFVIAHVKKPPHGVAADKIKEKNIVLFPKPLRSYFYNCDLSPEGSSCSMATFQKLLLSANCFVVCAP